jgi:hypothetical protein
MRSRWVERTIRQVTGVGAARLWLTLVASGVASAWAPALGHHTYATFYLESDTIEIEGDILEFQYKNPHAWVHVLGEAPFGGQKAYAAEWVGTSQLERDGITKNTLRAGDTVRIWAAPNRNPSDNRVHLRRIERRSDKWRWGRENREAR